MTLNFTNWNPGSFESSETCQIEPLGASKSMKTVKFELGVVRNNPSENHSRVGRSNAEKEDKVSIG